MALGEEPAKYLVWGAEGTRSVFTGWLLVRAPGMLMLT